MCLALHLFCLMRIVSGIQGLKLCSEQFEIHEEFCANTDGHNKQQNPDFPKPTTLHLEIIIRDILKVDEENHFVEFVAFSNLWWTDPRIDIRSISKSDQQTARPTAEELKKVWTTDITYANAVHVMKRFKYYTASKDKDTGLVEIKLTMLYRTQVTCKMDFSGFPFDSHTCIWKFRSYYENVNTELLQISLVQYEEDATLATKDESIKMTSKLLPFDIEISYGEEGRFESIGRENKSMAYVQFKFIRNDEGRQKLITGYYIPTGLFATLSMISYLIKPEIVPGRMGMLVVLFLICTNIYSTVEGPSSRGFSYIEVWYIGMFTPIVMAITEYAIVLAIIKYKTEVEYDAIIFGKISLKRLIAHIDIASLCLSFLFMIVFISFYYFNIGL